MAEKSKSDAFRQARLTDSLHGSYIWFLSSSPNMSLLRNAIILPALMTK